MKKMKVVKSCRSRKGCVLISWETMIGKTFEQVKKAA